MSQALTERAEHVRVEHPHLKGTFDAYRVIPAGIGPFPGVVIIHEAFGLNDNIRDIAHRFAQAGYASLAVDLFSRGNRAVCMFRAFYGILVHPLDNSTIADLRAALDYIQKQPEVDPKRIGAIGFCMGGSYALQLACVDGQLRAASVFYGQNPRPLDAVARACPIVGSYPEKDFTANDARKLDAALNHFNIARDIKIYPGAKHSFFNDTRDHHDVEASADAWARTLAFFKTHLVESKG